MNASPSLLQYIEQALHGLMVLLTGSTFGNATPDTPDLQLMMQTALYDRPRISALLVAESDTPMGFEDAHIIQARLEALSFQVQIAETKDQHMIFHVTGPQLDNETMARLFAPGVFVIGALEESDQWMNAFPDKQLESQGIQKRQMPPAAFETLFSSDPEPLVALMPTLIASNRSPFIYCENNAYQTQGCVLHTMKPELRISNDDIVATEISRLDEIQRLSYTIQFSQNAAGRFRLLTEANIKKPLPIVIDGVALSMPIVQAVIDEDTIQVTGDNFNSNSLNDALLQAQLFFALIQHPSLKTTWKLVHVAPIRTAVPDSENN